MQTIRGSTIKKLGVFAAAAALVVAASLEYRGTAQAAPVTLTTSLPALTRAMAGNPAATSITNTATLTGTAGAWGGTISYKVYSDAACTLLVTNVTPTVATVGAGGATVVAPVSKPATFAGSGTYYWRTAYSGDAAGNDPVTSPCSEDVFFVDGMTTQHIPLAGSIVTNTNMYDTVSLSGVTPTAGGTVTYNLYSDPAASPQCVTLVTSFGPFAVVNGVVPNSPTYNFPVVGLYQWLAVYSGDASNGAGNSGCQTEAVNAKANPPFQNQPSIDTTMTPVSPVKKGTSVTDHATLVGVTNTAGGTIAYDIWADSACVSAHVATVTPGANTVVGGVAPASSAFVFNTVGTFYFQATYSGDAANLTAKSVCDTEPIVVEDAGVLGVVATSGGLPAAGLIHIAAAQVFTVSIFQMAPVATSGMQASVFFDPAKMQINAGGLARGSDYPTSGAGCLTPPCGRLQAGISPQTIPAAITDANSTGVLKNASISYNPGCTCEPTVAAGTREALRVTFTATVAFDVASEVHIQGSTQEMKDASGLGMWIGELPDTDSDGCRDVKEPTLVPATDVNNMWDFYSVPVPALFASPTPLTDFRDSGVAAGDAQAVFAYFKKGAHTGTLEYDQDLNQNGIKDGFEYDRTVVGPGASGAPDGIVSAQDAQLAFAQFKKAYNC